MNISLDYNSILTLSTTPKIAIEGSNGVGKTTLVRKLSKEFKIPYYAGVPNEFLQNQELLHSLFTVNNFEVSFFYYLSGGILQNELLSNKDLIITDRSIISTIAYHYSVSTNDKILNYIENILKNLVNKCYYPTLTIYLEASYENLKNRLLQREEMSDTDKIMFKEEILLREREFYHNFIEFTNKYTQNKTAIISTDNLNEDSVFQLSRKIILQHISGEY